LTVPKKRGRLTPVSSSPHKRFRPLRTSGPLPIIVLLVILVLVSWLYMRYRRPTAPTTTAPLVQAPRKP
jgi:hypothetical protein